MVIMIIQSSFFGLYIACMNGFYRNTNVLIARFIYFIHIGVGVVILYTKIVMPSYVNDFYINANFLIGKFVYFFK